MPNKYIIVGAAFNGDGTTSSEAASNGGVGAWNGLDVMEGTAPSAMTPVGAGSVAAGDVVYIRSKTSAGADISRAYTAVTLGSSAGTLASPVTWVLDNGAIWAGVDGTLTYTSSTGTHTIALRAFNRYISSTIHRWVCQQLTTSNSVIWFTNTGGFLRGIHWNCPNRATSVNQLISMGSMSADEYCKITVFDVSVSYGLISASNASVEHTGLEIEILDAAVTENGVVFSAGGTQSQHVLIGGRLFGAGATTGVRFSVLSVAVGAHASLLGTGFQVPKAIALATTEPSNNCWLSMTGLDGGLGGAVVEPWGFADSRNIDSYYPYLNATNPDSTASGVSWRVYPKWATYQKPARLAISKIYTSAAAAKKITLEVLVHDAWAGGALNKSTAWMVVSYIDNTTGLPVNITTRVESGGALDASTAAWSATSWGAVGLDKYKLELTTPSSIKQDTSVVVGFYCSSISSSANDIFIVCPDPQLSTP